MNILQDSWQTVPERLGWAVLHSLWEGAAITALLAIALAALRRHSAAARYAVCLLALLAVFGAAIGTALRVEPVGTKRAAAAPNPAPVVLATELSALPPLPTGAESPAKISDPTPSTRTTETPASPALIEPFFWSWNERLRPWLPTVAALWGAGVGLLSLRQILGWFRIRRWRRSGEEARGKVESAFARLVERFGLRGRVWLRLSAAAFAPVLTGVVRPVILLPTRLLTGLTAAEIEAILAHELAHLARRDTWTNLAQIIVETVLFYHPAVWWISRRARLEREHAADDLALRYCGDRREYAGALARLAELQCAPSFALAATGDSLLARIRRIVLPAAREPAVAAWALPALAAVAAAVVALVLNAHALEPSPTVVKAGETRQGVNDAVPAGANGGSAPSKTNAELEKQGYEDSKGWVADAFQLDDKAKREAAIEHVRQAMTGQDADQARAGVMAFCRLGPIEFDKASFRPAARALLASADVPTRAAAASAFTMTGAEPEDLTRIFALADDPAAEVRSGLTYIIVSLMKYDLTGKEATTAILKLMDRLPRDARTVAHALWGSRFSPEIEERVLEFCKDVDSQVGYNFFYGSLSTQGNKSEASCKRLIEILAHQDTTNKAGRAAWGLQQGVAKAQYPLVAEAMLRVIEARSDGNLRRNALRCLSMYGDAGQAEGVKALLAKPGVTGEFRKELEGILQAIEGRK